MTIPFRYAARSKSTHRCTAIKISINFLLEEADAPPRCLPSSFFFLRSVQVEKRRSLNRKEDACRSRSGFNIKPPPFYP
jgi:hypothetical protein